MILLMQKCIKQGYEKIMYDMRVEWWGGRIFQ
jgi:hypothetical protein